MPTLVAILLATPALMNVSPYENKVIKRIKVLKVIGLVVFIRFLEVSLTYCLLAYYFMSDNYNCIFLCYVFS